MGAALVARGAAFWRMMLLMTMSFEALGSNRRGAPTVMQRRGTLAVVRSMGHLGGARTWDTCVVQNGGTLAVQSMGRVRRAKTRAAFA